VLGRNSSFLSKQGRDLSGGEMQITALLRAIQLEPQILMLDEPTSALDQATTEAVERCVNQWQREADKDRSLVVVSHDTEQVRRMADRRLSIEDGELVEDRG
jgi:putative ABC transport system ATP-binding protein